jgi:hypothetical protein
MKSADQAVRPVCSNDLLESERRLVAALQDLDFGRLESVRIHRGELVLNPRPTTVRSVKFGNGCTNRPGCSSGNFEIKKQVAEFFTYIRGVQEGVIRVLEVRGGLPFSMEIEYCISRGMPDVKGEHVEAV